LSSETSSGREGADSAIENPVKSRRRTVKNLGAAHLILIEDHSEAQCRFAARSIAFDWGED
jgi:hypothetical protein